MRSTHSISVCGMRIHPSISVRNAQHPSMARLQLISVRVRYHGRAHRLHATHKTAVALYLVMELCDGPELYDFVQSVGGLN